MDHRHEQMRSALATLAAARAATPRVTTDDGGLTFSILRIDRQQAIALTVMTRHSPITEAISRDLGHLLFPPVGSSEVGS